MSVKEFPFPQIFWKVIFAEDFASFLAFVTGCKTISNTLRLTLSFPAFIACSSIAFSFFLFCKITENSQSATLQTIARQQ